MKKRFLRCAKYGILLYLLFFLISVLLPPALWQTAVGNASLPADSASAARVSSVEDGQSALLWRLRMIASAQEEIILSTFDFHDDHSGQDIMAALMEAAERGVRIRIFVDGIDGRLNFYGTEHFWALAAHPNIEIKFYNPINLFTPWTLNYRMHDKYLLVDDTAYILGGRNTYDLFLGDYTEYYSIDRDVVVYEPGPSETSSVTQLHAYFSEIWALSSNQTFSSSQTRDTSAAKEALLDRAASLREQYPEAYAPFDWVSQTLAANSVRLLTQSPSPQNRQPQIWADLCALMKEGTRIRIQTPYIVCNSDMYQELTEICGHGASMQIMTNAPEIGANPFGCSDYLAQKENILQCGASVAEWTGGNSLHTKTILIDDSITVIGSYNLDMRSTYLNTEMMLVIDCPELNREVQKSFDAMLTQSKLVSPDGKETYGQEYKPVELPTEKSILYRVLSVLLLPFRYLL